MRGAPLLSSMQSSINEEWWPLSKVESSYREPSSTRYLFQIHFSLDGNTKPKRKAWRMVESADF